MEAAKPKKKMPVWKKIVIGIVIFFIAMFVLGIFLPSPYYNDGVDAYNKQDYQKAYDNLIKVTPDDKNYQDAIAKIKEIKPIVDSLTRTSKTTQKEQTDAKTSTTESNDEPQYNKIGDQIDVGNFSYVVNDSKFAKTVGNEFSQKTADGVYLIVAVTFRNNDNKEHTLDNSFFKLTDENGTEFESSTEGETALEMSGKETLFLKQCNPHITKSGLLIFEVPEQKVYDLHLSGGFWSGKTAIVKLTK